MTYVRRQPWRPRSPWLGARAGARRRGYRQDELAPVPNGIQDGVDVVMAVAGEAVLDDAVLAEAIAEPAAQPVIPARVDVSGLQAIAALAPRHSSSSPEEIDWRMCGEWNDEDRYLTRYSA